MDDRLDGSVVVQVIHASSRLEGPVNDARDGKEVIFEVFEQ